VSENAAAAHHLGVGGDEIDQRRGLFQILSRVAPLSWP
jgi:hypothetical protein